jgi:hypothetical protein
MMKTGRSKIIGLLLLIVQALAAGFYAYNTERLEFAASQSFFHYKKKFFFVSGKLKKWARSDVNIGRLGNMGACP